jgi:hypothetical protein
MTHTTYQQSERIIPQASLREEWTVAAVQQAAWSMGRPIVRYTKVQDAERRTRRMEALRRLAADPGATVAERALAAHRLADMDAASLRTAC